MLLQLFTVFCFVFTSVAEAMLWPADKRNDVNVLESAALWQQLQLRVEAKLGLAESNVQVDNRGK